jgi:hypothetical protein
MEGKKWNKLHHFCVLASGLGRRVLEFSGMIVLRAPTRDRPQLEQKYGPFPSENVHPLAVQ